MSPAGRVAPGYERVAEVFAKVVPSTDRGGAFAAYVGGEPVVDVWGGTARDDGAPWQEQTACPVFSGTKGVVATAMLQLVERGLLDLEAPMTDAWLAFGAAGKEGVTVGDVLAHTAGLPAVAEPLPPEALGDPPRLDAALAAQAPLVPIGCPTYHALTYGWLCDALARRVDGRSVTRIVAEDVAGPLGLAFWIGTPARKLGRVAHVRRADDFQLAALLDNADPDPRLELVYGNPPVASLDWSNPEVLRLEVPGAGGVGTARALARLYGCLAMGGTLEDVRVLDPQTVELAGRERSRGDDPLSGRPLRFGAGFELHGTPSELGPAPDAFGHTGSGGSSHGAWPGLYTGFSFVMRELRPETSDDRVRRLLGALHDAVAPGARG